MMRTTSAIAVVLLLAAACTGGGATTGTSPSAPPATPPASPAAIEHPTGPRDLVLRITVDGGFVAPGVILTRLPTVSVYGDGRVITEGPQIAIYPAPALPALRVQRLSEAGLQRLLLAARDAGLLGPDAHYPYPGVMDVPTTTFVVDAGGSVHRVSAYALGMEGDATGITPAEAAARARLSSFADRMGDVAGWLGADVVAADAPYVFDKVRVFVAPGDPSATEGGITPAVVDWPLPGALAGAGVPLDGIGGPGMRCVLLAGDDLATARPVLEAANQLTFVRSGGITYRLGLRPLLPDEDGCPTT